MAPALRTRPSRLSASLKEGGRGGQSARSRLLHDALVVAEFSLVVVLLVGAGLLLRSLFRLQSVNPGFSTGHVVTMQISLPAARYQQSGQVTAFYQEMLQNIGATPGVQSAAISMSLPPHLIALHNPFYLPGESFAPGQQAHLAEEIPVSPGYFRTLGVPMLRGRTFLDADRTVKNGVLIINQALAQRYFAGQDPVGKSIYTGDVSPDNTPETIVGVVGDVKYNGLDGDKSPTLYVPYFEEGWSPNFVRDMYIVVRTAADPQQVVPAMRADVWSINKDLPLTQVRTMEQLLTVSVANNLFRAVLFGIFAGLALVLAAIGIYGVLAYAVSERTHEIGIRIALGAEPRAVLRLVVGHGLKLALLGVAIGTAAALVLTRLLASLLFGVSASDPATFLGVALLLAMVALAACYVPARRAMRVDPLVALRYE